MCLTVELWQLIPASVGYFLGLQPMPNLDHTGSDVAELSSGSVLLKHRELYSSSTSLVTCGTQA